MGVGGLGRRRTRTRQRIGQAGLVGEELGAECGAGGGNTQACGLSRT